MSIMPQNRKSLLSSQARIQAPWIKVTIGEYTFGVFSKSKNSQQNSDGSYKSYNVTYPNYVQSLDIIKINGQVNQYTLVLKYPVTDTSDPNFFEKVFSSVSGTRKIVFSYGDACQPAYIYKDEEAIITKVGQQFDLANSVITYTVSAVSGAALGKTGSFTFINSGKKKPSDEIKRLFKDPQYGLGNLFTGMSKSNLDSLIDGGDKKVVLSSKTNISPIDYIAYLVGAMVPDGAAENNLSKDIWILTIHDDTVYDPDYRDTTALGGPYFKVTRTSNARSYTDAYEVDIGYNTSTIVSSFSVEHNENYSLYYDYATKLQPEQYVKRIGRHGEEEDIFAPPYSSKGDASHRTLAEDVSWFTKITKYPVNATIQIQGLLRPATLMQYLRLNVVFPGGHKHIASGLYIVTKQADRIDGNGYKTTLSLTKIEGDDQGPIPEFRQQ